MQTPPPLSPSRSGESRTSVYPTRESSVLFSSESVLDFLKLTFAGAPLAEVLSFLARLVEAHGNGMLCAIFLLDDDGRHLRCAAAPGLPVDPKCASPVYVTDILGDALRDDRRRLLPYGLRAIWERSLLSTKGEVLGTFTGYHYEPRSPSRAELQLIEKAANIAAMAIERHQNDESLRRSEARKAAILDSALDSIVSIDHEGRISEFNAAAERTFGYDRKDVVGRHLADVLIPAPLREKHRVGFDRYLATGKEQVLGKRIEMTALRADGSEFPVELAIARVPQDGPPIFTGYLRDITERQQAEDDLRRSGEFLAEAQRLSATGSFSWRVDSKEVVFSAGLYNIFEFDQDAPVTLERIGARIHPEDVPLLHEKIAQARAMRCDLEYYIRLRMPDESVKYLRTTARGTHDKEGRLEYVGATQDITQWHLSEEALSKARSELAHVSRVSSISTLTAAIAHEVNQPLSGIVINAGACLRMLAADPPDVEGARETARRTIRDGNRASEVIARLRSLFVKKDARTETVDLNEAAQEVIALSLNNLRRNHIILKPEFAVDLPSVTGDRVQLQQVILNLLLNASEAMSDIDDRPRLLVVKTERDGVDGVRLVVQDSGIGFEPHCLDKLFETFYTTKGGGMGIGLSISRSIIESHHGRLWASLNDGPGATLAFSLPRKRELAIRDALLPDWRNPR